MLFDGDSEAIIRSTISLSYRRRFVFIDTQAQLRVQSSRRPSGDLRDIICTQIPISMLSPYETAAPVTGSRFFGREYEISRILERPNTNHLILGIRRIGKTSLLKEVERRLREDEGESSPHIIYLDCSDLVSADDYIQAVVRKLNPMVLLRHLDKNDQRAITLDHLIDVYRDDSFKGHLVGSFMQNTTNREKGLIYALLNHMNIDRSSYFTQADMDMVLRQHAICVPHQTLDAACDTLKFIGILHQKGRDFSFTSPVFARVLQQTYDVHFLFQKAMEEGL